MSERTRARTAAALARFDAGDLSLEIRAVPVSALGRADDAPEDDGPRRHPAHQ